MVLNSSITELTTAATDVLVALVSLGSIFVLRLHRAENRRRVQIWSWLFGLLALASVLGAIAHGFEITAVVNVWLWRALYLLLGLVVALFVIGAAFDFWGEEKSSRLVIPMLAMALGFFMITQLGPGTFLIFVVYETVAMLTALGMYIYLASRKMMAGAGVISSGIVLNILAAAIQASDDVSVTIVVSFDHNGIFHIVQVVALLVMTAGLSRSMHREPDSRHS